MKQQAPVWERAAVLASSAVFAFASAANAQTVTLGLSRRATCLRRNPGIAAAQYHSNFDVNSFQLPIAHSFDPIRGGLFSGVAPHPEIALGYVSAYQVFPLTSDGNSPNSVKLSFNSWSALAGGGIEIPLGSGFKVRHLPRQMRARSYMSAVSSIAASQRISKG